MERLTSTEAPLRSTPSSRRASTRRAAECSSASVAGCDTTPPLAARVLVSRGASERTATPVSEGAASIPRPQQAPTLTYAPTRCWAEASRCQTATAAAAAAGVAAAVLFRVLRHRVRRGRFHAEHRRRCSDSTFRKQRGFQRRRRDWARHVSIQTRHLRLSQRMRRSQDENAVFSDRCRRLTAAAVVRYVLSPFSQPFRLVRQGETRASIICTYRCHSTTGDHV